MSVCKIEGCENESVQKSGMYGRLCETHALEKKLLRSSQQNGSEQGTELADESFDNAGDWIEPDDEEVSLLTLAIQCNDAAKTLDRAEREYRARLERLRVRIEAAQQDFAAR